MAHGGAGRQSTPTAVGSIAFGGLVYGVFLLVLLYFIGFVADLVVPVSVDAGGTTSPWPEAVAVDTVLVLLFAVPHSVLARRPVKAALARVVPAHLERSLYVLVATGCLVLLFWQWRPVPQVLWETEGFGAAALWAAYTVGWVVVVLSTFLIDHFDLFGLRQVYLRARGLEYHPVSFRTPLLYRVVRHPMMLGFFLVLWGTPRMTVGHLLFALGLSAYILVGIRLEERDLRSCLPGYREYAQRVPRLLPGVAPTRSPRVLGRHP